MQANPFVASLLVDARILLMVGGLGLTLHAGAARADQGPAPLTVAAAPASLADYTVTNWSEEQGPFPFGIYAMAQDREGYLWLGVRTGLVRFDGSDFVPWKGRKTLPNDRVAAILSARDGSLWVGFGTIGGVARIADGSAVEYTVKDGLAGGDVNAIVEDVRGTIWVASHGGLSRFDGRRWSTAGADEGLPTSPVLRVWCDSGGRFWVVTATGLYRRHADAMPFTLIEPGRDGELAEDLAGAVWITDPDEAFRDVGRTSAKAPRPAFGSATGRALLVDRNGALWVGTRGAGLLRVYGDSRGVDPARVEQLSRRQGLLSDEVRALVQDHHGSIWIGSRRGLTRLSASSLRTVRNGDGSDAFVSAVATTRDGAVWTATATGLRRGVGAVEHTFTERDGLPSRVVTALHEDRQGTLWVATTLGVARRQGARFVAVSISGDTPWPEYQIRSITTEVNGDVWLCDQQRGVFRWRDGVTTALGDVIGSRKAYLVYADRVGRVWIGYWDGGLAVYDHGRVSTYGVEQGLPRASVNAIFEDRTGSLWVGTDRDLGRVEGARVRTFTGNGFPASVVTSMLQDEAGDYWVGLGASLLRVDPHEFDLAASDARHQLRYRLYDAEDGLPGTLGRPGIPNAARASDGTLLFVTSVGLVAVDPHRLLDRPAPVLIRVDGVSADGRDIDMRAGEAAIPSPTSRLAIRYSLLNLTGGRSRFRHRLDGFDRDWQEAGDRREVSYTNLPPGEYRFHVASRHEDVWIEARAPLLVTIPPAFYQTRTFAFTLASSLGLVGWFGWRRRVRQIQREFDLVLAERSRLGREIHDTLLQSLVAVALEFDDISEQLGPTKAALKDQVVRIRTRVEQYILEARQSIANLRSPMLEQSDLGTALQRAGEGATASHGIRFDFSLVGMPRRLESTLEEQLLRIGQEAVSNAVQHGDAHAIYMELCFEPRSVRLRISDDGCGFDPDQPPRDDAHWGIAGMRERAARVGAQLRLVSHPGAGTTVEALVSQASRG